MQPPLPMRCVRTSSLARVFVRLLSTSAPSAASSSSSSSSILELLLPPRTRALHLAASREVRPAPLRSRSARNARPRSNDRNNSGVHVAARRPFSATAGWRKTQVVHNPQQDEDGNDMVLEITPRAAHRLSKIMDKDKNPNLALRISVESGGCHGFQYLMSLTTLPPSLPPASAPAASDDSRQPPSPSSSTPPSPAGAAHTAPPTPSIREDDTIFEFVKEAPSEAAPSTPKVILDSPSLSLLKGSKVDFTMELIGSQFKIVDNPAATSSCGCGTSFDVKF
ncbi:hypothetical protein F4781DRAFT_264641 [Annulohypoxylon bovei var. microspora]|nr:hypothetical protein F4781DRAFT_264641 [Annulohypoxylon bovei var. microspora]